MRRSASLLCNGKLTRGVCSMRSDEAYPGRRRSSAGSTGKARPTVSVAVGLSPGAVTAGRIYNFLPMGEEAVAPLHGHLDAPFFAEIDRRNADFELPLNATLMEAAAEACATAALHIAGRPPQGFPSVRCSTSSAWTGRHAGKLDVALDAIGSSLRDAPVVPAIASMASHGPACPRSESGRKARSR